MTPRGVWALACKTGADLSVQPAPCRKASYSQLTGVIFNSPHAQLFSTPVTELSLRHRLQRTGVLGDPFVAAIFFFPCIMSQPQDVNRIMQKNLMQICIKRPGPKSRTAPKVPDPEAFRRRPMSPSITGSPSSDLVTSTSSVENSNIINTSVSSDECSSAKKSKRPGPKSRTMPRASLARFAAQVSVVHDDSFQSLIQSPTANGHEIAHESADEGPYNSPLKSSEPMNESSDSSSNAPPIQSDTQESGSSHASTSFTCPVSFTPVAGTSTGKNLTVFTSKTNRKYKRKSTPTSVASRKRKRASTHEDLLNMDDPDYTPEFNAYIKSLPIDVKESEYFTFIPRRAMTQSEFNCNIHCKECHARFVSYTGASGIEIPSKEYYKHCLEDCPTYPKVQCRKCCHNFLDQEEHDAHLASQCLTLFKKKVLILRLKAPWMPRKLFYDLLDRKINDNVICYASTLGCFKSFPCEMTSLQRVLPGIELYVHCVSDCPEYESLNKIKRCAKCSFAYINESDYQKYDPCAQSVGLN